MGAQFSVVCIGFQVTYRVYGLDFENTYDNLKTKKNVQGLCDVSKGNFDFWLDTDGERVRVQISNKGAVNLWCDDEECIIEAVEEMKRLVVDQEGNECQTWLLTEELKLGSERLASKVAEDMEQQCIDKSEKIEPEVSEPLLHFKSYREIFEKLLSFGQESNFDLARKYIDADCSLCKRLGNSPPLLPEVCPNQCKGSLYKLAEEKVLPVVERSQLPSAVIDYLCYEYKAELFVLAYETLKEGMVSLHADEWCSLRDWFWERLHNLYSRDNSLEPKILAMVDTLLSVDADQAEKALRISMNAVKWHIINGASDNPVVRQMFEKTQREYYEIAVPILNKARQKPSAIKQMRAARWRGNFASRKR
jgi:hypothetical protein